MIVTVKDKFSIHTYEPHENSVLIRISDSWDLRPVKQNYQRVIKFHFYDITDKTSSVAIKKEEAIKIAKYIKLYKNINEIVVHCDYGKGRSPAIAKVISEKFGVPFDTNKYPGINMLVYNKVKQALSEVIV